MFRTGLEGHFFSRVSALLMLSFHGIPLGPTRSLFDTPHLPPRDSVIHLEGDCLCGNLNFVATVLPLPQKCNGGQMEEWEKVEVTRATLQKLKDFHPPWSVTVFNTVYVLTF